MAKSDNEYARLMQEEKYKLFRKVQTEGSKLLQKWRLGLKFSTE